MKSISSHLLALSTIGLLSSVASGSTKIVKISVSNSCKLVIDPVQMALKNTATGTNITFKNLSRDYESVFTCTMHELRADF